jgi:NAD(P)-dependent dehydrogenase (short-subunit alcohol dehydrogenase family)
MGRATAISYARYGARGLVVADINEPGVRKTAEEAKRDATHPDFEVLALFTDVRSFESVENVFNKAVEKFGRIDYSVSSAGVSGLTSSLRILDTYRSFEQIWKTQGLLADNPLDNYEDIMNTNARGVLYHTKAAIRVMRRQEPQVVQGEDRARVIGRGSIVNVASDSGIDAYPGSVEYNASKAAAISITKTAGE